MIDNKILNSFLHIYLFFYIDSRRCDFCNDNLSNVLSESIDNLNNHFSWTLELILNKNNKHLDIDIKDFNKIKEIDSEVIKLLDLLSKNKPDDIIYYVDINFDWFLKYKLKLFFFVILEEIDKSYFLYKYADNFSDPIIKELLFFYYHAFIWDSHEDIKTSISYTEKLIKRYPHFISFRLFKIRQTFELFYRVTVWKHKFNKLVASQKGKDYLFNHPSIIFCFEELDKCNQIIPWNYVIDLFKWKLLLHLLDEDWVKILLKVLEKEKLIFDDDVYSWIWVYYLQVWDQKNAKFYIDISRYHYEDLYKYYSKIIYFYKISWDKGSFLDLFNKKLKDAGIVILSWSKYYIFKDDSFISIDRPNDINDITRYINFWINNSFLLLNKRFSKFDFLSKSFDLISNNYFHHWSFSNDDKIYFCISYE